MNIYINMYITRRRAPPNRLHPGTARHDPVCMTRHAHARCVYVCARHPRPPARLPACRAHCLRCHTCPPPSGASALRPLCC